MLTEWMLWLRRQGAPPSRRAVASVVLPGAFAILVAAVLLFSLQRTDSGVEASSVPSLAAASPSSETLQALQTTANDSDVWSTQSQRARKWQVAKMQTLSRLLSSFPDIDKAIVLLEPGEKSKLGRPGTDASAAVHLVLASGSTMTPPLLRAVIDQTAGAVADLSPQAVRVIDSSGRSYTLADAGTLRPAPKQFRRAEKHYRDKIQSALAYVTGMTVVVETVAGENEFRCGRVILSLPVSHAETIYRRSGSVGGGPKTVILDGIMRAEGVRVRRLVAAVAAVPVEKVAVEWHYDAGPEPVAAPADATRRHRAWIIIVASALALTEAGVIAGIVVRRIRRRRRRLAWGRVRAIAQRRRARLAGPDVPPADFEAIIQANLDDLVTLLSVEEPQTVAMVLSHLSPARAAKLLGRFSASRQAEVVRQIAELSQANPETLRRIEQDLTRRWADREQAKPVGGVSAVAHILQYTHQVGRKNVLETLQQHQPDLAERISRRLLCFEDLAGMDPDHLAGALGSLSGEQLALALWTADETLRPPLINALSPAQREAMEQAAEQMGPVRLSQVVSAQQHIVDVVREFEAGQLAWAAAGKDEQMA